MKTTDGEHEHLNCLESHNSVGDPLGFSVVVQMYNIGRLYVDVVLGNKSPCPLITL